MRHQKTNNHLGRTSSHRKAMLSNMANSLILHKRITTTTAKAKALRTYIEPLITKSKVDSTHSRRAVFSYLKDKKAVAELFREVSPKIAERPGGYTRILKTGNRLGDNAEMCIIELVDFNENMLSADAAKAKTGRRRRSTRKKSESGKPVAAQTTRTEKVKTAEEQLPAEDMVTDEVVTDETAQEETGVTDKAEDTTQVSDIKEEPEKADEEPEKTE